MSRRTDRLSVLFRSELADLISSELRDPRVTGMISITSVDVSPDLERATVYVSVLADDAEQQKESLAALNNASPFLRRKVMARVHIRRVPTFEFEADHTIEEGARMLALMKKVAAEREPPTDR
ncbi:MAG: 30S ribosome-binding factor RbfA [Chloroflexi bacterium]|nr:30S ribosome-binding factor RbfA [Chloroflexota bacterium]MCI0838691.1 30S ribosome-binding factor RbfA [Chloroflexota bacterium]MCI0882905.1 30S ribosome-binding factor RbfA [Chloroflexota bacterium]MCI0884731.1 30S ribosome-binding factor RbfA [Chloroflexota bacterium]